MIYYGNPITGFNPLKSNTIALFLKWVEKFDGIDDIEGAVKLITKDKDIYLFINQYKAELDSKSELCWYDSEEKATKYFWIQREET